MAPPLVSIVIPCYNHAHFVGGAIESARSQTWPRIETIVVDDGSTDRSSAVASAAGATRVYGQPNRGLSAARNAGLAAANGEFVVFLDADDELLPEAVERGVTMLQRSPDAAGVVRQCRLMDADGRPLPVTHPPVDDRDLYRALLHTNFVWTPGAAVFRTEAVRAVGGFLTGAPAAADYALLLALARRGLLVRDVVEVVRYRKHASNMSGDPVKMLRQVLRVLEDETKRLPIGYEDDLRLGRRLWHAFYGDQIVERLRIEWRGPRRLRVLAATGLFLCRHCPAHAATHGWRKISRLARGLPSEPYGDIGEQAAIRRTPELAAEARQERG